MESLTNIGLYGGLAVAAVCITPVVVGFGTAGVAAGSVAAGIQSSIGIVQGGSLFATATSLGMKGVFLKGAIAGGLSSLGGTFGKIFSK
jgi:hypothetical protein